MARILLLACILVAGIAGCTKSNSPTPTETGPGPAETGSEPLTPRTDKAPAADTAGEADLLALLAELTQAARRFGVEQQRAPKTLDELVAAGYLPSAPAAPTGKRFVIDKNLKVIVAGP
jgi:hypothetical protein